MNPIALPCLWLGLLSPPPATAPPAAETTPRAPGQVADFRAQHLELNTDSACGRLLNAREVAVEVGSWSVRADAAEGCVRGPIALSGVAVSGPRLRLSAAHAAFDPSADAGEGAGSITAEDVWLSGCGCDDPPWHLTATQATLHDDQAVSAHWPVLWAGHVPVLASPVAWVPVGRRRSGFLLPRLGYDAEDGLYGALPFFWAPADAFDLTAAAGWRNGRGPSGEARLRWAQSAADQGHLGVTGLLEEGLVLGGRGSLALGPARLGLDGEATTDAAARRSLAPGLLARGRDHLRFDTGLHLAGPSAGAGLNLALLTDNRRPGALGDQPGVDQVVPGVWVTAGLPLGDGRITLDGRLWDRTDLDSGTRPMADVALTARRDLWLGPLRLRPEVGAAAITHLAEDDRGEVLSAWSGLIAEVGLQRAFAGGLRHAIVLVADARAATVADRLDGPVTPTTPEAAVLPIDRTFASRSAGLSLVNRLGGGAWRGALTVRAGLEGAFSDRASQALEPVQVRAEVQHAWLNFDAAWAGATAAWGQARLGTLDGPQLLLDAVRLQPGLDHPWLRNLGTGRPWRVGTDAVLSNLNPGLSAALGPLRMSGKAVFSLEATPESDAAWLGWWGALGWAGRCDCWHARIEANQERDRSWPDVRFSLGLTAL